MKTKGISAFIIMALIFVAPLFGQTAWTTDFKKVNPIEGQAWKFSGTVDTTSTLTGTAFDISQYDFDLTTAPLSAVITLASDTTIKIKCIIFTSGDNTTYVNADTLMIADSVAGSFYKTIALNKYGPYMKMVFTGTTGNILTTVSGWVYARKEDD